MKSSLVSRRNLILIVFLMVGFIAWWTGDQFGRSKPRGPTSPVDWGKLEWGRLPTVVGDDSAPTLLEPTGQLGVTSLDSPTLLPSNNWSPTGDLDEAVPRGSLLFQSPAVNAAWTEGSFAVVNVAKLLGDPKQVTKGQIAELITMIGETVRGTPTRWVFDSSGTTQGGARLVLYANAKLDLTEQVSRRLSTKQRGESSTPPR